jgi:hypothetical protein
MMLTAELEAARDYWSQVFERFSADSAATLVERDHVLRRASGPETDALLKAYGLGDEAAARAKAAYLEEISGAPITSPGIDPHAEAILESLRRRIVEACARFPILGADNVATGVEPKLGVTAARMGVMMTDASVVTVGSQVFRFCNVVGKAAAQTILIDPAGWERPDNGDAMRAALRKQPGLLVYWFQIVMSFAVYGAGLLVPLRTSSLSASGLRGQILDALEIYAVAHEYSHHTLKHGRLTTASPETGTDEAARREEFEADTLAIAIGQLITGNRPDENPLMVSGAGMVIFLRALEMVQRTETLLGRPSSGADGARSHPPAADRLAHIDRQEWLWQSHEEALRSFRNAYGLMMQLVWDELSAVIERLGAGHPLRDPAFDFRNSSL